MKTSHVVYLACALGNALAHPCLPLGGVLTAQQPAVVAISEEPICPQCVIRVTPHVRLGTRAASKGPVGLPSAIVVDNSQRYWLLGSGTPIVFDSVGKEVESVAAGRERNRPFAHPYHAVTVADSVIVFDPVSGVASVIGPNLEWVRDIGFDIAVTRMAVIRWPDVVIGSGLLTTPQAIGWGLHRIGIRDGNSALLRSFGSGDGQLRYRASELVYERPTGVSRDGSFWSFYRANYDLTRWDSTQQAVQRLKRRPGWFPEATQSSIGGPRQSPSPVISAVQVDSAGLLWVFASVPSAAWPTAWPPARPGLVEVPISSVALEKLYRTAIEVIDPEAKRVVARTFLDSWVVEALPNGRAVTYEVDQSGKKHFSIVSLTIDYGQPPSV